jgi:hypothetical protein
LAVGVRSEEYVSQQKHHAEKSMHYSHY